MRRFLACVVLLVYASCSQGSYLYSPGPDGCSTAAIRVGKAGTNRHSNWIETLYIECNDALRVKTLRSRLGRKEFGGRLSDVFPLSASSYAIRLARGGASSSYNYDDDYYRGQGGGEDDPYYNDGRGWDGGGREQGGKGRSSRRGYDYDPYEEAPTGRKGGKGRSGGGGGFNLTGTIANGNKKWGIFTLAGSLVVTMMGVSLFFEKNLMRLGNLGFVAGMALLIGPGNVVRYFTQRSKLRGSLIFAVGFFLVFTGHPIIGLAIEIFGFLNLFGNMLPMVGAMAKNLPFIKDIIGERGSKSNTRGGSRSRQQPRSRPPPMPRDYEHDYGGGGGGGRYYDDPYGDYGR